MTLGVLALALLVTGVLAWAAFVVNDHNESRLLRLKVAETGAVFQVALPTVETPLASAVEVARPDNGGAAGFRRYMSDYVGAKGPFAFAALWTAANAQPVAMIGRSVMLARAPARVRSLLERAATHPGLSLQARLTGPQRVLAYAYASPGSGGGPIVYAESALPTNPRVRPTSGTPFSDLRFALYLGRRPTAGMLLETNAGSLGSRTASTEVPFGDQVLTIVGASNGSLGGGLSTSLWWIVAIAGGALSLIAAGITERLLRDRQAAEILAADVQRLLERQQTISSALQRSMIPRAPSGPAYLEIASRYLPGGDELEIGGDWFDVIELDADRTFLSIGDVSGRGLAAGSVMASLRAAMRAFVSEGHGPADLLDRLAPMLSISEGGRFATVTCLVLDRRAGLVTAASAGHLPPLVVRSGTAEYLDVPVGPPIGAAAEPTAYRQQVFELPADTMILLFTDGLVERRSETIDDGLARLSRIAAQATGTVDEMLERITTELTAGGGEDDTAVLGVRRT